MLFQLSERSLKNSTIPPLSGVALADYASLAVQLHADVRGDDDGQDLPQVLRHTIEHYPVFYDAENILHHVTGAGKKKARESNQDGA